MGLPLEHARLCLDCDLLTPSITCPACGGSSTFPLSGWLRPLIAPVVRAATGRMEETVGPDLQEAGRGTRG